MNWTRELEILKENCQLLHKELLETEKKEKEQNLQVECDEVMPDIINMIKDATHNNMNHVSIIDNKYIFAELIIAGYEIRFNQVKGVYDVQWEWK